MAGLHKQKPMSTLTEKPAPASARRIEYISPRVDLHQDADGYTLEVEMPGVTKDGVEVTVEDGKLTLLGRRSETEGTGKVVYTERTNSEYRRVFDLDPGIDSTKVTAGIDQGLLKVRLLKAEAVKPRKITVN